MDVSRAYNGTVEFSRILKLRNSSAYGKPQFQSLTSLLITAGGKDV